MNEPETVTVSFERTTSKTETITVRVVGVIDTRPTHLRDVARSAIIALIDARDFLAYQLSHAQGGMTDDELDAIADEYLRHVTWEDDELQAQVDALASLIPDRLDADVLSTVFACDMEQASRVLTRSAAGSALDAGETRPELGPGDHG